MLKMLKEMRPSPFIRDVGLTAVTSSLTILSILLAVRLLAQGLGTEQFGAYSLARQIFSTMMPFSTLAMGVALTRYIAMSRDKSPVNHYLFGGLFLVLTSGAILLITGFVLKDKLAVLIFHNKSYSLLFIATLFMLVGYSLYSVLYAFYRGMGKMRRANLWQLGVIAFGPVLVALGFARSGRPELIVFLMGVISFSASVPLILHTSRAISQNKQGFRIKGQIRELLEYGLPRVPGGFAFAGILAVGPFLAPYFGSLKEAGYLLVGQSLFRVAEGGVEAFGIVALPKVAQLLSEEKEEFLKDRIGDTIALVFHLGLFIMLHLWLWSDQIVLTWLGGQYTEAVPLIKIMLIALVPYLSYVMLRSFVDAVQKKAINTFNLYFSFIIALGSSLFFAEVGFGVTGLAVGTTIGFISLGLFTTRYLWRSYRIDGRNLLLRKCLLINVAYIITSFLLKSFLIIKFTGLALLTMAAFIEGLFFLLYCLSLWKLKAWWMVELRNRLFEIPRYYEF